MDFRFPFSDNNEKYACIVTSSLHFFKNFIHYACTRNILSASYLKISFYELVRLIKDAEFSANSAIETRPRCRMNFTTAFNSSSEM